MRKKMTDEERRSPRYHEQCNEVTPRYGNGACIPCTQEAKLNPDGTRKDRYRDGVVWCEKCGAKTKHRADGSCIGCEQTQQELDRQIKLLARQEPRWHAKCEQVTPRHPDGTCIPCRQESQRNWKSAQDRSTPRWCEKCQQITERNKRDGSCVACYKQYQADYHAQPEHQETARQRVKQWRQENPEWNRANIKAWELANPERAAEIRRQNTRRRRARKINNGFEPYEERDIFIRDDWICHLGKQKIDPSLPRNHLAGATIDHLITISSGGPDTPDNVAAAHFICNLKRGTTPLDQYTAPPCEELLAQYLQNNKGD